jgi:hypothetical protein
VLYALLYKLLHLLYIICSIINIIYIIMTVSIAELSETSTVFSRSNVEIAGSNPARGMDVCLRFSVFVLSCV